MRRGLSPHWQSWLLVALLAAACRQTPEERTVVQGSAVGASDVDVVARLDASVLQAPSIDSEPVGTVLEGDLLTVLGQEGEFSRVHVRATGSTGWLYSNLCLSIPRSPYWEGDTNRTREAARRIYQDKFLVQRDAAGRIRFPVAKVRVEAAFNTVTFAANEGTPKPLLDRKEAEALAVHWIKRIGELLPEWKDPVVHVRGFDGTADYLMTLGNDRKPHFF